MYMHSKKKKKVIIPRLKQNYHRVCFYPSSCPTREGLLMKQFWQLVYEAAWYIYVFIYLSFFNLLYTFSEKKSGFGFGEIEGFALNVAKQTDWNDPKCQHAVTGCSQKDKGRCNFLFCRFVFYLHWIPQWPRQCKTYLSDKCQALNSMNEQM